jgi:hypothetical protein
MGGAVATSSNTRAGVLTQTITAAAAAAATSRSRPEMQEEDLGMQLIEGVVAQGHRNTMT